MSDKDTIYRQAAIDVCHNWDDGENAYAYGYVVEERLQALPSAQPDCSDCIKHGGDWDCDHVHCHKGKSAQPERKKGKWKVTPVYITCSECGESFMLIPQNYCPNCGSFNGGEDE